MSSVLPVCAAILFAFCYIGNATVYNIEDQGAVPNNRSLDTCIANTGVFNKTLSILNPGDTLLVPSNKIFWFIGGIYAANLSNITIQIDGTISYTDDREAWPRYDGHVVECMKFEDMDGIAFTSSNGPDIKGLINGNGKRWWGAIDYLVYAENRPRLLHVYNSKNILIENIFFKNSPYWNVWLEDVRNVHIHHSNVSAKRDDIDYHDLYDITAFNTDGFDVAGENVYIHDCEIWNDDDCIAVKEQTGGSKQSNCSRNMLFERINASGVGLTIGSIGPSTEHTCVQNITFRDCYMYRTFKGIYMKSRPPDNPNIVTTGIIRDVLYENIVMDEPTQVPIWIGPQQAVYEGACSLLWPEDPLAKCPVPSEMSWFNITLRNVTVNSPRHSPGVILGNNTNPMRNIIFDRVIVNNPGVHPWGDKYYDCDGVVNGSSIEGTTPKPPCFS